MIDFDLRPLVYTQARPLFNERPEGHKAPEVFDWMKIKAGSYSSVEVVRGFAHRIQVSKTNCVR